MSKLKSAVCEFAALATTVIFVASCTSAREEEAAGTQRAGVVLPSSGAIVETFDGLGPAAAAALPANWRVDRQTSPRTIGTFAAASTNTISRSGALMSTSGTNSIYNFGAGVGASTSPSHWLNSTDRAVGWLGTGASVGSGGTKSGNLYLQLQSPADRDLSGIDISYDVEEYRGGTTAPGFSVQLFWSIDGVAWTNAGAAFHTSFAPDAGAGYDPAPGSSASVATTRLDLSVPRGSTLYLGWHYTTESNTSSDFSSASALAIDNVRIAASSPFLAWSPAPGFQKPTIVLPSAGHADGLDLTGCNSQGSSGTGGSSGSTADFCKLGYSPTNRTQDRLYAVRDGILLYLRRGIEEMTGEELAVSHADDPSGSAGIAFALRDEVPMGLQTDPAIMSALGPWPSVGPDYYEAFFVRSSPNQLLVLANHPEGWVVAIPQILESVGYETLGYGPDWTSIPDFSTRDLAIELETSGRPGYLYRYLQPAGSSGNGTAWATKPGAPTAVQLQPGDEFLQTTMSRFRVGTRSRTASIPKFTGDGGATLHNEVLAAIRETPSKKDDAFLNHTTTVASLSSQPGSTLPSPDSGLVQRFDVWIDTDVGGNAYYAESKNGELQWVGLSTQVSVDTSTPWVRDLMFARMKAWSEVEPGTALGFVNFPTTPYIFSAQPADGGTWGRGAEGICPHHPESYGLPQSLPYALNGYQDIVGRSIARLNHANAEFSTCTDAANATDHLFALANELLKRYDADPTIPQHKKDLIRVGVQSYNQADVLPSFNLDQRIVVSVAGYAKHRGSGEWAILASHEAIARAMRVLLPSQPIQNYELVSLATSGGDETMAGALNSSRSNPMYWAKKVRDGFDSGIRSFYAETDYNGGKLGLAYYLMMKVAYDPQLTNAQLLELKNHWIEAAYGTAAAGTMNEYYNVAIAGTSPVRGPNQWAQSVNLIEAASATMSSSETASKRRLDDLKQHWLHYYLVDTRYSDQVLSDQIYWKGQMGYQISARVDLITLRGAGATNLFAYGIYSASNPLHFTEAETTAWWQTVRGRWHEVPVTMFEETQLFDGTLGSDVDVNDLVLVQPLATDARPAGKHTFNGTQRPSPTVMTLARTTDVSSGQSIGCRVYWANTNGVQPAAVNWGVSYYRRPTSELPGDWEPVRDFEATPPADVTLNSQSGDWVVEFSFVPDRPGVYRIQIGKTGQGANLVDLGWDVNNHQAGPTTTPLTFSDSTPGLPGQHFSYFYLPKQKPDAVSAAQFLQFEAAITPGAIQIVSLLGSSKTYGSPGCSSDDPECLGPQTLPGACSTACNSLVGAARIGSFARYPVPYMYNIPRLWAPSPRQLLVPRKVAEADGLTIVAP